MQLERTARPVAEARDLDQVGHVGDRLEAHLRLQGPVAVVVAGDGIRSATGPHEHREHGVIVATGRVDGHLAAALGGEPVPHAVAVLATRTAAEGVARIGRGLRGIDRIHERGRVDHGRIRAAVIRRRCGRSRAGSRRRYTGAIGRNLLAGTAHVRAHRACQHEAGCTQGDPRHAALRHLRHRHVSPWKCVVADRDWRRSGLPRATAVPAGTCRASETPGP